MGQTPYGTPQNSSKYIFLQPDARPGCFWAFSGLFFVPAIMSSWASCFLLLRNGRKFQCDYSFIPHFGEKAKLLLEVVVSWPRGQNIAHNSFLWLPPLSHQLLCDMWVGAISHFPGFLEFTVSQVGNSSSRGRIPFGLIEQLALVFFAETQQTSRLGAQTHGRGWVDAFKCQF